MIRQMRRASLLALVLASAGCSGGPAPDSPREYKISAPSSGSPSAAKDVRDLEAWNGQEVTLEGIFESDRAIHGVVRLSSGLRVWLSHFDLIARGDDWLSYVGRPCSASGVLHTYTRDIDGYRQPRLEVKDFSGTRE